MTVRGKSVLVTGGAGFIGSHLVDRLVADGPRQLVVVDNFFLGNQENLRQALQVRPDVEVIRLDASDLAAMQDIVVLHDVDVVFDLAVVPLPTSLAYPEWTVRTNVGIVLTFCELARRGAIADLVHVSSSEAYGTARYVPMDEGHPHDAITPYAASKSAADHILESYVQTFGVVASTVRPFNNFGPRQNPGSYAGIIPIVVRRVMEGRPIEIHGDGEQTRDFLFVRETADMIVRVYENESCRGRVLNVASGHETTIKELVARILRLMGRPDHEIFYTQARPGDVRRHCADVGLASSLIGLEPRGIRDEDLLETIEWYRSLPQ
jgi:UDP-glucose 4-epimerase